MEKYVYKENEIFNASDVYNFFKSGVLPDKKLMGQWVFHCTDIDRIELPESFIEVGAGAFCHSKLVEFIGNIGLKKIGYSTFAQCYNLARVEIPFTVKVIEDAAFKECLTLRELTLPYKLEECGKGITRGCVNLRKMVIPEKFKFLIEEVKEYNPEISKIVVVDDHGKVVQNLGKLRQSFKDQMSIKD